MPLPVFHYDDEYEYSLIVARKDLDHHDGCLASASGDFGRCLVVLSLFCLPPSSASDDGDQDDHDDDMSV